MAVVEGVVHPGVIELPPLLIRQHCTRPTFQTLTKAPNAHLYGTCIEIIRESGGTASTLVCLVYLLEPSLGFLRDRRIHTAIGNLIRVPPLRHYGSSEDKRQTLLLPLKPGEFKGLPLKLCYSPWRGGGTRRVSRRRTRLGGRRARRSRRTGGTAMAAASSRLHCLDQAITISRSHAGALGSSCYWCFDGDLRRGETARRRKGGAGARRI